MGAVLYFFWNGWGTGIVTGPFSVARVGLSQPGGDATQLHQPGAALTAVMQPGADASQLHQPGAARTGLHQPGGI
jgi:hypothetical protein